MHTTLRGRILSVVGMDLRGVEVIAPSGALVGRFHPVSGKVDLSSLASGVVVLRLKGSDRTVSTTLLVP